jgi:two-component sensor histidine kinase
MGLLSRLADRQGPHGRLWAVVLAVACVALASFARAAFGLAIGPTLPFATYFPAILVAALFGGSIAGIVSIALSVVVVWWAFTPPYYEFGALTVTQMANITLFSFSAGLIVWLAVVYRDLLATLEQQEKDRMLLVGEVEHRGKNFLTVVESLIHQTIDDSRAQPLINRIRAVVSTQDILDTSSKRTADLRTILAEELGSYGSERVRLDGPPMQLAAATARAMRLVFHELGTNALKHGALSQPNGKIAISWRLQNPDVQLDWREMEGPKVAEPASYNFGSKLITRTLKQLNAKFEPTFAETGYCYRMTIPLAE